MINGKSWVRYPFTALVGLEELKTALLVTIVNPKIGGLLIRGPKGSGKSTAIRSVEDILPEVETFQGCRFNCGPGDINLCHECAEKRRRGEAKVISRKMRIVTLPLGATEDRVIGSIDVEKAIRKGREAFKPGILAEANNNILYVDEINLLPDYIVDDLLDVAASGINIVEREGVSFEHPSQFVLLGTMNPEEGELRPQLLDRLSLSVTLNEKYNVKERREIIKRNHEFKVNPVFFYEKYRDEQRKVRLKVKRARELLPKVRVSEDLIEVIAETCYQLNVDGIRPDLVIFETSCALAALDGRSEVNIGDVEEAAKLALGHRTRNQGLLEPATKEEIEKTIKLVLSRKERVIFEISSKGSSEQKENKQEYMENRKPNYLSSKNFGNLLSAFTFTLLLYLTLEIFLPLNGFMDMLTLGLISIAAALITYLFLKSRLSPFRSLGVGRILKAFRGVRGLYYLSWLDKSPAEPLVFEPCSRVLVNPGKFIFKLRTNKLRPRRGKRVKVTVEDGRGRVRRWKMPRGQPRNIYLPATIREASKHQLSRVKTSNLAINVKETDLREKVYGFKAPVTAILVLDLSDSMSLVKTRLSEVLKRFYWELSSYRDKVAVVGLKGMDAFVISPPTTYFPQLSIKIEKQGLSGLTPLASGLMKALRISEIEKVKDKSALPLIVLFTDGFTNVPLKTNPLTLRKGEKRLIATDKQRAEAIEDVAAVANLIKRKNIKMFIINPDPSVQLKALNPNEIGVLYRESMDQNGFNGETFLKLASKKFGTPAIGSTVTGLIAYLTGGRVLLTPTVNLAIEAFKEAFNPQTP